MVLNSSNCIGVFAGSQVSGTIRNCCFEAENQLQNLLLISEFLWPALLLPVAGNKVSSFLISWPSRTLSHTGYAHRYIVCGY